MDNDKSYRKSFTIKAIENKINEDKKGIALDTALLGVSALAVGLGALGIVTLGPDIIEAFNSNNALTLGSYMIVRLKGAGIALSFSVVLAGAIGIVATIKDIISSINDLNHDKDLLEVEINKEKGKSLVKRK
ncbi:MAG: hypothetical protein VZS44_00680 [Bacilli bacterium]|nr:hypothetical protein [Bacilli bacterium]